MTISQDLEKAELPARIDLFTIDASAINGSVYRYTPMTNGLGVVVFNGESFLPYPIEITNVDQLSDGPTPRPQLGIGAVDRFWRVLASTLGDLKGAVVYYTRTYEPYLNSGISAAPMKFKINKKPTDTPTGLLFELVTFLDADRKVIPARQMLRDGADNVAFPGLGVNKDVS